jgi:hypothetical protein
VESKRTVGGIPSPGRTTSSTQVTSAPSRAAVASIIGLKVVGRESVRSFLPSVFTVGSGQNLTAKALVGHIDSKCCPMLGDGLFNFETLPSHASMTNSAWRFGSAANSTPGALI